MQKQKKAKKSNRCEVKLNFNEINKSLKESNFWDKPEDKVISSIMQKNFKRLGIKCAK